MKKLVFLLTLVSSLWMALLPESRACTSAIISGRLTPDGRPLLWKHRDTQELNNRVDYISRNKNVKYAFIAVVNASRDEGESWMGVNEAGFAIINTASSNMRKYPEDENDQEGKVMYKALASCRTLADFENFLNKNKPLGVETNFGVIDAQGGAAYYETNSYSWTKQDINDPTVAPLGYKVYTNFSPTGTVDGGGGYIRYATADNTFRTRVLSGGQITPQWVFDNLSRNYSHPILGVDLRKDLSAAPNGWTYDMDFIPRKSTASSAVIKGVKNGENPLLSVMWVVLGYPPVSVAVPTMVAAGADQPAVTSRISETDGTCPVSNAAMARRAKVFPIKRGSGPNYVHFDEVCNAEGSGYLQRLAPVEQAVFEAFDQESARWYASGKPDAAALKALYGSLDFGLDVR
jgi:hypothetical protein